ncbi:WD40-repeat-containing domain protein [Lentinula lateritia]|uniref:WD40-repeat-containing domain protein n=1 Tax=Lentinula aff. lateritia TaxID=2804960 RepID=A0ACC1UGE2_9AGAR|nr:WD40-repeat-containing domain protein [Lentinula aff. lateritia]KAJ3855935.1 WD40-repeat-containing domain protein [Lentinula lateritia]
MFDTILPADSVEFCPHPDALNIFVCGTYNLIHSEETVRTVPQKRNGQCLGKYSEKIQALDYPALPDMKWCHRSAASKATLGVANSEGEIHLLEWDSEESRLEETARKRIVGSPVTLCLSLDWSNRRNPTSDLGKLVVSCSDGDLVLLDPTTSSIVVTDKWTAHEYEPWIAAWNYWNTNTIYSGGDDFKLKGWDIRTDLRDPMFVNKRFDAGITTIQSHPYIEHLLAVGSYDSSVKLFDIRKPLQPLSQTEIGGGAWRVKWHPSATRKSDLLVACMHDGFKVLRFNELAIETLEDMSSPLPASIVQRFDEHQSLAYGVDWSFAPSSNDQKTAIASCSFYDHELHFWSG